MHFLVIIGLKSLFQLFSFSNLDFFFPIKWFFLYRSRSVAVCFIAD